MPGPFANLSQLVDCSDAELEALVEQADFSGFEPGRDLAPLRERLLRLEREHGVTDVHRRFSGKVLAAGARLLETPRYIGMQRCFALSPDGRHLAIASNRLDESHGGDVRIWELATGRVVDAVGFETTLVGSAREPSCLQWSPSGAWLGVILDNVVIGVLRAFAGTLPSFTADLTRRWGSPPAGSVINPAHVANTGHLPAWCWSPDEKQLFISTPGPDGALGCIVPFREGTRVNEDSEGLRWCPARLDGQPSRSRPHTWVRWSPDGARIQGYCKQEFVLEPNAGPEPEPHPSASTLDVGSGNLEYRFDELTLPVAFSPDGARLAYGDQPPRLANGHTGRTMTDLGKDADVRVHGVEEYVWSRDGRRLAVLINGYEFPQVLLFNNGKLLGVVDLKRRAFGPSSRSGDLGRWAWSPDGSMGACLLREGKIELWKVGGSPKMLRRLEGASGIDGLAWGADDTLVGTGHHDIAFWDVTTGALRFRSSLELEPGRVPPPSDWNPWLEDTAGFIPTERGWDFTRAQADGTVVCPPGSREKLEPRLMFSVGGRHAWPWRWAVGTPHARWEDGAPFSVAPLAQAPFEERHIPVPEGETLEARDDRHGKWGFLRQYQAPTRPLDHYKAEPVFTHGPAICRANLTPYLGQGVLLRQTQYGTWYALGALLEVSDEGILLHPRAPIGSYRERLLSFRDILWIGPAVPLEPPGDPADSERQVPTPK
ncbi:WD40 repeat domain-containing protein [Corallococcus sp. AB049A]|uniref:WD40 repeat domain-containing protein n=1 Tax=Corallococcus sp. AB049A TaxID=2316721 RepID=UPI000EA3EF6A|nr:WD40 repeat domain-containing protein [Corallococcus sp. AB049A]RKH53000.1 WD40 repeat domain-containing protein [Corallococcus sp. AB050B]RKI73352.1 WD40 repeat domain-containing protein [Corallococcus sp. AB049A]